MNDFSFCETIKINGQKRILLSEVLQYFGSYIWERKYLTMNISVTIIQFHGKSNNIKICDSQFALAHITAH